MADAAKAYGIDDFVQSGTGQEKADEKTLWLKHGGDTAVLVNPSDLGVKEVLIQWDTQMHLTYYLGAAHLVKTAENNNHFLGTYRLGPGDTAKSGPIKEEYWTNEITLPNGAVQKGVELYVGDVNTKLTLLDVTLTDGSKGDISGGTETGQLQYAWEVLVGGVVKGSGVKGTRDTAIEAAKAYGKDYKLGTFDWTVKDFNGDIVASGTEKPGGGEFPWWLLGVGLTAAVVIVILLWLWKSGKLGAPAAPASPAAPAAPAAAPAVMVVKT